MRLYFMILVSCSLSILEIFAQGGNSCKIEVDLAIEIYKSQGNYNQVIETIESCVASEGKLFSNQNLITKDQALAKALYLNSIFHNNDSTRIAKLGGVEAINIQYQKISKELSNFGIKIQQNQRLVDLPDEIAEKETQLKVKEEKQKEDLARKIREAREKNCRQKVFALLNNLPRLFSGAHWLSDVIVGGGAITLLVLPFAIATPIAFYIEKCWQMMDDKFRPISYLMSLISRRSRI